MMWDAAQVILQPFRAEDHPSYTHTKGAQPPCNRQSDVWTRNQGRHTVTSSRFRAGVGGWERERGAPVVITCPAKPTGVDPAISQFTFTEGEQLGARSRSRSAKDPLS